MAGPDGDVGIPLLEKAAKQVGVDQERAGSYSRAARSHAERISKRVQRRRDEPATLLGCAVLFGVLSGLVAFVYSWYFEGMLRTIWEVGPHLLFSPPPAASAIVLALDSAAR